MSRTCACGAVFTGARGREGEAAEDAAYELHLKEVHGQEPDKIKKELTLAQVTLSKRLDLLKEAKAAIPVTPQTQDLHTRLEAHIKGWEKIPPVDEHAEVAESSTKN